MSLVPLWILGSRPFRLSKTATTLLSWEVITLRLLAPSPEWKGSNQIPRSSGLMHILMLTLLNNRPLEMFMVCLWHIFPVLYHITRTGSALISLKTYATSELDHMKKMRLSWSKIKMCSFLSRMSAKPTEYQKLQDELASTSPVTVSMPQGTTGSPLTSTPLILDSLNLPVQLKAMVSPLTLWATFSRE